LARTSWIEPISELSRPRPTLTTASFGRPITSSASPITYRKLLKRVKRFARRIVQYRRDVDEGTAFVSPRSRAAATWADVSPAAGSVSAVSMKCRHRTARSIIVSDDERRCSTCDRRPIVRTPEGGRRREDRRCPADPAG
jgi:hypothetical protein